MRRKGFEYNGLSIQDVCQVLLRLLGLPLARDMAGNVPEQLRSAGIGSGKVSYLDSYGGKKSISGESIASRADEEIVEQLRSPGYLDQ